MSSAEQRRSNPQVRRIARVKKVEANKGGHGSQLLGGKRRIKAKHVLLYIPDGDDIVVQTPPACTASKCLPSASHLIGLQQPAVTGAPPLVLLTCDPAGMSSQQESPSMT